MGAPRWRAAEHGLRCGAGASTDRRANRRAGGRVAPALHGCCHGGICDIQGPVRRRSAEAGDSVAPFRALWGLRVVGHCDFTRPRALAWGTHARTRTHMDGAALALMLGRCSIQEVSRDLSPLVVLGLYRRPGRGPLDPLVVYRRTTR